MTLLDVRKASFILFLCVKTLSFTIIPPTSSRRGWATPTANSSASWKHDGIFSPRSQGTSLSVISSAEISSTNRKNTNSELESLGIHIPFGLHQKLRLNAQEDIRKRFWIVDNSGSMALWDGEHSSLGQTDYCTRWCEVQETVACHSQLSAVLGAPTDFTLLNPAKGGPILRGLQRFRVGYGVNRNQNHVVKDCKRAQSIMLRNEPTGRTPLSASIKEVRREIVRMQPELEKIGRKVCLVIATDGCNYNSQNVGLEVNEGERQQELVEALKSLQGLPVNIVVRLCTNHEPVVDFWNDLDQHLEGLNLDVLDDHRAEAEEVYQHNPWLNYALILHRMREMGQECQLFDLLDERPFTKEEVREFCSLLFGVHFNGEINDDNDWKKFIQEVDNLQQLEKMQWNPRSNALAPWINTQHLAYVHN
mmetsp:Transcript_27137/g.41234  ORF Transcript_27137/g.41234 Transcript_27137/m.41234 type:complete len:420 (-) Transcript_27137:29-1288(-)